MGGGVLLAVVSAVSFGLSGSLASGLLATGWSPGAVVLTRMTIAAFVMAAPAAASLRGRWRQLVAHLPQVVAYAVVAVAASQFCYFSAVQTMDVGPALLIEYTAPATVVAWLWARHGRRPGAWTVVGAATAAIGLVLVLDLLSGSAIGWPGVGWALAAMVGLTVHFLISGDTSLEVPALALAGAGLFVGTLTLGGLGALGVLPLRVTSAAPTYAAGSTPWWVPVLALGLVTAALAYGTGIAGTRLLGPQVASFVALLEVVAGVGFAWWLLAQKPTPLQSLGGLLVLAGAVMVKRTDGRQRTPGDHGGAGRRSDPAEGVRS